MVISLFLTAAAQTPDASAIRVQDVEAHIQFLAHNLLEGRESGERGGHLAAHYVASHFRRLGLQPLGKKGSFLLPFEAGTKECLNTAGLVPGTDPNLSQQILVIGGHHDHAGTGDQAVGAMGFPGEIHNGADDNASGTAGVLELAEYFASNPTPRPILFLTFSAEERGLLGSQWFVQQEIVPLENMRAMINLDMIGRSENDYLFVGGLGTAFEFHDILNPVLKRSSMKLELSDGGQAPSDNTSFHNAGIPALFFFTNIHDQYHLPEDDAHLINYPGHVRVLKLVRDVAVAINEFNNKLTFEEQPEMAMPSSFNADMMNHFRTIQERSRQRGRLGINTTDGLHVTRVRADSAAAQAGIREGDIILRANGHDIHTEADLRRALGGLRKKAEIDVVVKREGERQVLAVTLN